MAGYTLGKNICECVSNRELEIDSGRRKRRLLLWESGEIFFGKAGNSGAKKQFKKVCSIYVEYAAVVVLDGLKNVVDFFSQLFTFTGTAIIKYTWFVSRLLSFSGRIKKKNKARLGKKFFHFLTNKQYWKKMARSRISS